jgi:hypothetical protein
VVSDDRLSELLIRTYQFRAGMDGLDGGWLVLSKHSVHRPILPMWLELEHPYPRIRHCKFFDGGLSKLSSKCQRHQDLSTERKISTSL